VAEPLNRMLMSLSALLKVPEESSPLPKVQPRLKEPVKGSLDMGVPVGAQTPKPAHAEFVSS